MATLIPEITISEFKLLKVPQLKRLKSCEVYADGQYLFTFTNASTGYIRDVAESNAELSNSVSGEDLEHIKEGEHAIQG